MNEKLLGKIISTALCVIIFASIFYSFFCLIFRDGRGIGLYGNRGNDYMYDDYLDR